jgi:hypothetical protein
MSFKIPILPLGDEETYRIFGSAESELANPSRKKKAKKVQGKSESCTPENCQQFSADLFDRPLPKGKKIGKLTSETKPGNHRLIWEIKGETAYSDADLIDNDPTETVTTVLYQYILGTQGDWIKVKSPTQGAWMPLVQVKGAKPWTYTSPKESLQIGRWTTVRTTLTAKGKPSGTLSGLILIEEIQEGGILARSEDAGDYCVDNEPPPPAKELAKALENRKVLFIPFKELIDENGYPKIKPAGSICGC